jgi:ribose transport system permease protein
MSGQHPPVDAVVIAPYDLRRVMRGTSRLLLENGICVAFVLLFVTLCFSSGSFFTTTNLLNVLESNSEIGIVACAFTLVVVAAGLDLSVGAIFAFSGIVAGEVTIGVGVVPGLIAGIACGAALGAINGFMVTVGRINSFIATLAAGIVIRGLALVVTGGYRSLPSSDSGFTAIGRGDFLGIAWIVWIFAATALVCGLTLSRGRFGRSVSLVGINPVVARLSGIATERVRFMTFVASGLAAGLAGVIIASRSGQAGPEAGVGMELPVIAAVAIGGTSISGGEGAIWRTVLGVLFIGLVNNGLNLLGVDSRYQDLVLGLLILAAVSADLFSRRYRARSEGG